MPRLCTICTHPARATIDGELVTGQSLRTISAEFGLSKSAVDRHKGSHLPAALAQDWADLEHECQEAWQAICDDAAEPFLDPQLMATLWQLRQGLLEAYGAASPAITMVIDLAVISYHNALRVQGWIGDLARTIERELFGEDSLKVTLRQHYGAQFDGFVVEEQLQRLGEHLLPLCERANRQVLQNLQALQRPRPGASPTVAIGWAGQVNVAQQQVNLQRKDGHSSRT